MSAAIDYPHCKEDIALRSNPRLNGAGSSIEMLVEWEIDPRHRPTPRLARTTAHLYTNLIRRAANATIRNRSNPCFQREMFVVP
jgi:hypothetical protein